MCVLKQQSSNIPYLLAPKLNNLRNLVVLGFFILDGNDIPPSGLTR